LQGNESNPCFFICTMIILQTKFMNKSVYYDLYRHNTKLQKRIIDEKNFTYRIAISLVRKYLRGKKTVLDVGCGVGTIDFFLCKEGYQVLGVDISNKAIKIASYNARLLKINKHLRFISLNFLTIKTERIFDAIIILEVLEHIDDNGAMKVINRLSSKHTIVIASSPSRKAPLYRLGLLKKFDRDVGHLRRYSEKEYRRLFENNGFKIIDLIKTEGILRNILFTNKYANLLVRFIKGPITPLINFIDDFLKKLFGGSNYYVIAKKK